MLKQYSIRKYDFRLIFFVLILSTIGILLVGSALPSLQKKQIYGLAVGIVAMVITSLIDYNYILNFHWILYILNIVLLVLVQFMGSSAGGATRWISIAGIRFQPSELSKLILILFFAKFLQVKEDEVNSPKVIILSVILIFIPWILIKKQPDLSTSIVLILIFCALYFIAGISYKFIAAVLAVVIPAIGVFVYLVLSNKIIDVMGYQGKRIMAWLYPNNYVDEAYQQLNSITAIGSGMIFGKGLNNNVISSVKNGNFISEPQTDFIYAVAGEELGFVGGCVMIGLFVLICFECFWIGRQAKNLSGRLICCGIGSMIGFQAFINICVTTGLMPNTGLPLPFVSYGLTSLVTMCISIGIVLNVGLQPRKY